MPRFIDDPNSLVGDTLISVLRQQRFGHRQRAAVFPQSVILCSVRDVRDYRIHSESTGELIASLDLYAIMVHKLVVISP